MTPVQPLDAKLRIMGIEFDDVVYDKGGDVLYLTDLSAGKDADWDETPEGVGISFDAAGRLRSFIIPNAKWLLENEGKIEISIPIPPHDLAPEKIRAAIEAPPKEEPGASAERPRAPARSA